MEAWPGALVPSPDGRLLACAVEELRDGGWSTETASLRIIDVSSGAWSTLLESTAPFSFGRGTSIVWSPDGARLALSGADSTREPPLPTEIRVLDMPGGGVVARLKQSASQHCLGFDERALRICLRSWAPGGREEVVRWVPSDGDRIELEPPVLCHRSPDGRFQVRARRDGLMVRDGRRARELPVALPETACLAPHELAAWIPQWLGDRVVVLPDACDRAVDLEELSVRPLLGDSEAARSIVGVSPTLGVVLVLRDRTLVYGRV
jgi:hypothetical protein